ncbi:MAG TPA: cob(I)yrinic acid a,c-diamide adenosyltransferase [Trueperaceae bacterium]|nr:cob(I)yrinic acid a,c-diamide adenosyltransferase [Trueperaceae bacterium]
MKIYTRTGDGGDTGLFGGGRVPKDDPRVATYGTVDEANSALGLARAQLQPAVLEALPAFDAHLAEVQSLLFDLGADLATPLDAKTREYVRPIDQADVDRLEELIDKYDALLPALRQFILPAGTAAAAALHLARSVARRAEREAVTLARVANVNQVAVVFLNRLSDLLFVLARVANVGAEVAEVAWESRRRDG